MAALNNVVLGLLRRSGVGHVPDARRYYAANLDEAAALILHSPALAWLCHSRILMSIPY